MNDETAPEENQDGPPEVPKHDIIPPSHWARDLHPASPREAWMHKDKRFAAIFVKRSPKILVVSFDNLGDVTGRSMSRGGWGYSFFEKQDYSHLSIMVNQKLWFRTPALITFLEGKAREGFFEGFETVAFTGASMGAFAALAFSRLVPGCNVIAFSPQTTLEPKETEWDQRYQIAKRANWNLPYSDAAEGLETANKIYVVYDPIFHLDNRHVKRLPNLPNITLLRLPGCGHKTPVALRRLDKLAMVQIGGILGNLDVDQYYKAIGNRRHLVIYRESMVEHILARQKKRENPDKLGSGFGSAFVKRRRIYLRKSRLLEARRKKHQAALARRAALRK